MEEGELYIDPPNVSLKQVSFGLDSSSGSGFIPTTVTETGWSTFKFSFNTASVADDLQIIGLDVTGNASFTRTAGDVFAIRNVKSTIVTDAFVTTWYDQSGNNNNASQPLDDAQPRIAENGSLLTNEAGRAAIKTEKLNFMLLDSAIQLSSAFSVFGVIDACLLYTSPSPRDGLLSRMPSSA